MSGSIHIWFSAVQPMLIKTFLEGGIGGGSGVDMIRLASGKGQPEDKVRQSLRGARVDVRAGRRLLLWEG